MKNKHLVILCLVAVGLIDLAVVLPYRAFAAANGLLPIPQMQGQRDNGTSVQGFPVLVGFSDGTNVRNASSDASGNLNVNIVAGTTSTIGTVTVSAFAPEGVTHTGKISSNGATAVNIVAASGALKVTCLSLVIENTSTTVNHRVNILSSGGTVIHEFDIPATSSVGTGTAIFNRDDWIITLQGEGLQFKFTDGTGSVTDLVATATYVSQ